MICFGRHVGFVCGPSPSDGLLIREGLPYRLI